MKTNFPANTAHIPFFEQTMEITSRMMAFPVKKLPVAAAGPARVPALTDMVFEDYAMEA